MLITATINRIQGLLAPEGRCPRETGFLHSPPSGKHSPRSRLLLSAHRTRSDRTQSVPAFVAETKSEAWVGWPDFMLEAFCMSNWPRQLKRFLQVNHPKVRPRGAHICEITVWSGIDSLARIGETRTNWSGKKASVSLPGPLFPVLDHPLQPESEIMHQILPW